MRDEPSLCAHLAACATGRAPFTLAPEETFDWWAGPVEAVVRCTACGACGWLERLDWDPAEKIAVFALAAIRDEDVRLYLRDRARGSCDLKRGRAELEALAACAGPFERILALALDDLHVVAAKPIETPLALGSGAWLERIPSADDTRWFAALGLVKRAR